MSKRNILLILLVGFINFQLVAQQFTTENGKAEFLSKAPLNEFTGKSQALKGLIDLDKNLVDFYLDLNTLKTGIGLRDKHMRDNYLETKKYPFAEFTGSIQDFDVSKFIDATTAVDVVVKGLFKVHGVEKSMTVNGRIESINANEINLQANFVILLEDFAIERPSVLFYELADRQEINILALLKLKK